MLGSEIFSENWTKTLSELYPSYDIFFEDYQAIGLNAIPFKDNNFLRTIYLLLMGEYGSSAIMNMSEDLFRVRLFTRIMSYGPQFERELDVQKKLLELSDEDLQISAKAIYNTSMNPSQKPTTNSLEELPTVNQQSVTTHKRSQLDAWDYLGNLLDADLTRRFIKRFDGLFVVMLKTNNPLYYKTMEDEE